MKVLALSSLAIRQIGKTFRLPVRQDVALNRAALRRHSREFKFPVTGIDSLANSSWHETNSVPATSRLNSAENKSLDPENSTAWIARVVFSLLVCTSAEATRGPIAQQTWTPAGTYTVYESSSSSTQSIEIRGKRWKEPTDEMLRWSYGLTSGDKLPGAMSNLPSGQRPVSADSGVRISGGTVAAATDPGNTQRNAPPSAEADRADCSSNPSSPTPVVISTGTKLKTEIDFVAQGLYGLSQQRNYRSSSTRSGMFGPNWWSSFDRAKL